MESIPKKILILEDEKPLAKALELKLSHEGFEAKSFSSGEGIISLLEKENFSLIICDLIIPKVDGFHVLELIKENKINIPVIILTNLSQKEDEKRALDLGARNFFVKSDTSLSSIVDHVKEILLVGIV